MPGMIIYVFTSELDGLRQFYEKALGVKGASTGPNWVAFPVDNAKFALHRQLPDEPRDPAPFRLDFLVSDIDQALERCKAAGAEVIRGVQDEAFGKSAILRDPEGREFTLVKEELG